MQTDVVEKAGINPKTLLSSVFYWQKLERNISAILFLPYLALTIVATLSQKATSSTQTPAWEGWLLWPGIGGLVLGVLYNLWAVYAVPKIYARRVRAFARKNNLSLLPQSKLAELIPASVRRGDVHNRQFIGCALPVAGQSVTVFDYSCVTGTGKNKKYLAKSLAVVQLKGSYPHLFLDSKKNGKNHQYAAKQKVELEGNFSKYFDVYMPEGSQAGSLTVFAPDMMQTILDSGKLFDVEINGNQAVIISDERAFTRKVLPNLLTCAAGLTKEFKELDQSWQPVFAANGKSFKLQGQPLWRLLLIAFAPVILGLSFGFIPEKFRQPIKNQPNNVVIHQENSVYEQDATTLAMAYQVAGELNAYTAKYPVPDSLAQAHIANTPPSISYAKLSPDKYEFCTRYNVYINGNGPTGASGNIVAYYGATADSPNLPATLQIVEWHGAGKNCQIIKPMPPAVE